MSGSGNHEGDPPSTVDAVYQQVRAVLGGPEVEATPSGVLLAVAPGIRAVQLRTPTLPPATHTACYLVGPPVDDAGRGEGDLVVVDPASPYPAEQAALDAVLDAEAAAGRRVAAIWLTHHHGDHVGGAAHLAARLGVPVVAHDATADRLRGAVAVHRSFSDGDEVAVGGRLVRAVHTPGHAPGHLVFLDLGSRAMIAGDMVAGVGTILVDPSEGDMVDYLASLERMAQLAPSRLLPAHGPMIDDAVGRLRGYVAHRLMREGRVLAALARAGGPAPLRALVADAYADTPPPLWGLAERSLLAHLVKLERDGRAQRRDGDAWSAG
jgi:ribonuclease/clavin/mitogillin